MKALPAPPGLAQALRNQAMALRQIATRSDAMAEIGRLTAFHIGKRYFHNDDLLGEADKGLLYMVPATRLSPLELIDDACALEVMAAKLDR